MDSDSNTSLYSLILTSRSEELLAFAPNKPTAHLIQWEGLSKACFGVFLLQISAFSAAIG